MNSLFPFFQPLYRGEYLITPFIKLFFGEKYEEFAVIMLMITISVFYFFVIEKKHRKWKLYKRIMKDKAKRQNYRLPEKLSADIFPDTPPTPPEEKEP